MSNALASEPTATPTRSRADAAVCRLLCIPAERPSATRTSAERLFSLSMVVSGLRCLLSYVLVPILAPVLGAATGVEPYLGIPIGLAALVFDVLGIRRFWLADHRRKWQMTAVYLAVMVLVTVLVVRDVVHLIG